MDADCSTEQKAWLVYSFGKRNVLDYGISERVQRGFLLERKGKVIFHVDGPKTKKAREPIVESLVPGIWRLRVSEAERRVRGV